MNNKLILASAGAGKTTLIAKSAIKKSKCKKSILILTYTQSNQKELKQKIVKLNKLKPSNIKIKGWFSFLLDEMIRPYQNCIFDDRISGIIFNERDPHKRNGRTIPGRKEIVNGKYNPIYYLSKDKKKAHTTYLSKLASRIIKETKNKPIKRLMEIYDDIYIDEVQDLIGWDYELLKKLSKQKNIEITCVGDFRQTIYSTAVTIKKPKTNAEKLQKFEELGFKIKNRNISWRCIQIICDFSNAIHTCNEYLPTKSKVKSIPYEFKHHLGVFIVRKNDFHHYINQFNPTILRHSKKSGLKICKGHYTVNFGESKGLTYDRTIIIPTKKHMDFIKGATSVFDIDKTDDARNRFYVAITRSKYSVAFVFDGDVESDLIKIWQNNE